MKIPLLRFALCLSLALVATQCDAQEKDQNIDLKSRIALISDSIESVMEVHDVPAVSACIVKGDDVYFINHGVLNRHSEERVDEESIYQIASLSKTFVGLVAYESVRNETISPNDSISDYLPETAEPATRSKLQPISMLDLIYHRSGLPRDTFNRNLRRYGTYVNNNYDESDLLKDLNEMNLRSLPGEEFEYSNFGYSLLAYLLERASGKSYKQLVREYVTGRLKMSDTGFDLDPSQERRRVTPYDHKAPSVAREPARIGRLGPPTSLYSTTSDLAVLMNRQLAAYRKYQSSQEVSPLILTLDSSDAWEGTGIRYGYGFFDWGNGTFGHGGGMDGYGSEYSFDPKRNFGFILLTSSCEAWTQRLTVAVNKTMADGHAQPLNELVAVETIIAAFEKRGPEAALKAYKQFREQDRLGEQSRITLVNLALRHSFSKAAKLLVTDALADFPRSKRIKAFARTLGYR